MNGLLVLEDAYRLALDIYRAMSPTKGRFKTRDQLEGSSTSVFANLSEIEGPLTPGEKRQRVRISITECYETIKWLEWFRDTGDLEIDVANGFIERMVSIRKRLYKLKDSLN